MSIYEKLEVKMNKEMEDFEKRVLKLPPKNILNEAFKITYMNELLSYFQSTERYYDKKSLFELYKLEKPLHYLYDDFVSTDIDYLEPMEDCIRQSLKYLLARENQNKLKKKGEILK